MKQHTHAMTLVEQRQSVKTENLLSQRRRDRTRALRRHNIDLLRQRLSAEIERLIKEPFSWQKRL